MGCVAGRLHCLTWVTLVALAGAGHVRPASADELTPMIPVPSGQDVRWVDTISDTSGPDGLTLRFRFLAPRIGGDQPVDPDTALADMQVLCENFALPRLPNVGPRPGQVVISLSDRVIPFGEADEEAVQYFEAYSVGNGTCEWELF